MHPRGPVLLLLLFLLLPGADTGHTPLARPDIGHPDIDIGDIFDETKTILGNLPEEMKIQIKDFQSRSIGKEKPLKNGNP